MNADQLNWREMVRLVGGIAAIAFFQASILNQGGDLLGAWIVTAIFGASYAALGAMIWARFDRRRRGSS
jgi:hypothetical protein